MTTVRLPLWFWLLAVAGLLWNLSGVLMFWQNLTISPEAIAALPDTQRQITEANPRWTLLPFALATLGGALGMAGLLLRRRWSVAVLQVSLLALVVQFVAIYLQTPVWALTGVQGALFPLLLWLVAALLWLYARHAQRAGWLR